MVNGRQFVNAVTILFVIVGLLFFVRTLVRLETSYDATLERGEDGHSLERRMRPALSALRKQTETRDVALHSEKLLRRINEASNWRQASVSCVEIVKMPPDKGLRIAREIYSRVEDVARRRALIDTFWTHLHQSTHELLLIAAADDDPSQREYAMERLDYYSALPLSADPELYEAWKASIAGRSLTEIMRSSLSRFQERFTSYDPADIYRDGGVDWLHFKRIATQNTLLDLELELRDLGVDPQVATRLGRVSKRPDGVVP